MHLSQDPSLTIDAAEAMLHLFDQTPLRMSPLLNHAIVHRLMRHREFSVEPKIDSWIYRLFMDMFRGENESK